jgi:hypothetical protein
MFQAINPNEADSSNSKGLHNLIWRKVNFRNALFSKVGVFWVGSFSRAFWKPETYHKPTVKS